MPEVPGRLGSTSTSGTGGAGGELGRGLLVLAVVVVVVPLGEEEGTAVMVASTPRWFLLRAILNMTC